jgi:hypothetical protein
VMWINKIVVVIVSSSCSKEISKFLQSNFCAVFKCPTDHAES